MENKGDGAHNDRNRPDFYLVLLGDLPPGTQLSNDEIEWLDNLWNTGIDNFDYLLQIFVLQQPVTAQLYSFFIAEVILGNNENIDDDDDDDDDDEEDMGFLVDEGEDDELEYEVEEEEDYEEEEAGYEEDEDLEEYETPEDEQDIYMADVEHNSGFEDEQGVEEDFLPLVERWTSEEEDGRADDDEEQRSTVPFHWWEDCDDSHAESDAVCEEDCHGAEEECGRSPVKDDDAEEEEEEEDLPERRKRRREHDAAGDEKLNKKPRKCDGFTGNGSDPGTVQPGPDPGLVSRKVDVAEGEGAVEGMEEEEEKEEEATHTKPPGKRSKKTKHKDDEDEGDKEAGT